MIDERPPKYDLHCHSNFSDGELSPTELVIAAKEQDITHLALTDHDTVDGLSEARSAADQHGLELINGVEISASWRGQLLHVLGLGIDPENPILAKGLRENQARRWQRAEDMVADFAEHGIEIEQQLKAVLQGAVPTRPHFAQALINLGLAKNKQQAFKRYLVRGKPGYIPLQWPSIDQIAHWIHSAGGTAVLAHPLRYKFTRTKLLTLIDELGECGVHAIEVSTPTNDANQIKMLEGICLEKDLNASMGSDFHAHGQPWARLGSASDLSPHLQTVWNSF